ncbi:protein translocase subunit SecD [Modestobacter marinus]|uniref:protein translocase subunit SecD n=1 Tax=Modestobacter marinus TaxID=477641 RepID=UPI001C93C078|nr:protein translocase subunit SecD [Modestobacter marinus]
MAARQLPASRYFAAFILIIATMYALIFLTGDQRTPQLGLDLQGGTTVTLTARTPDGKAPATEDLELARQIIEQRVNGLGVAEAEVVTEGDSNIVISVPGEDGDQARELGATAQLRFRPVLTGPEAATPADDSASATPSDSAAPTSAEPTDSAAPSAEAEPSESAPATTDPAATGSGAATDPSIPDADAPVVTQEQAAAAYATLTCDTTTTTVDRAEDHIAACSDDGTAKFLLGPAVIEGTDITDATAGTESTTGAWVVNLDFNSAGSAAWAEYTAANVGNNVAITLDGRVVSAPTINGVIAGGTTQITGNFSEAEATELANQLKYGALPLTFTQATAQSISTELGSEQLRAGLIAGAIGIALVFVYALFYYRILGLVMIASLLLSAVVVYACLVLLGREIGFALSLAGIAGFIVSVGITADSFVVYFERLKDEIREGRSLRSATPRAWVRARRTILSADAVSFLAAAILYWLAIGDVKGFAFTLGLSTVLDLIVVFLFTHPLMAVLSRVKAFGTTRFSGLGNVDHSRRPAAPRSGRELVGAGSSSTNGSTR